MPGPFQSEVDAANPRKQGAHRHDGSRPEHPPGFCRTAKGDLVFIFQVPLRFPLCHHRAFRPDRRVLRDEGEVFGVGKTMTCPAQEEGVLWRHLSPL